MREKKELETVFRLFWNNINQQMMDYQNSQEKIKREIFGKWCETFIHYKHIYGSPKTF